MQNIRFQTLQCQKYLLYVKSSSTIDEILNNLCLENDIGHLRPHMKLFHRGSLVSEFSTLSETPIKDNDVCVLLIPKHALSLPPQDTIEEQKSTLPDTKPTIKPLVEPTLEEQIQHEEQEEQGEEEEEEEEGGEQQIDTGRMLMSMLMRMIMASGNEEEEEEMSEEQKKDIEVMVEMGFDRERATKVYIQCHGNLELALSCLTE